MTDDEIPPLLPPDQMPPITDQASLERTWRALMGRLGFATPQLWVMFLKDDSPPHLLKVEELPLLPTQQDLHRLAEFVTHVVDNGSQCAFLFARPGRPGFTAGDLAWARGLGSICSDGWPVHVANDVELRVVAPDDLAQAG